MNKQDAKARQLLEHERQKAKIKIKKAMISGEYETVTIGLTPKKEQLREPSEDRTIDWESVYDSAKKEQLREQFEDRTIDWASVYDSAQTYIERTTGISGCAMRQSAKDLVSILDELTEKESND